MKTYRYDDIRDCVNIMDLFVQESNNAINRYVWERIKSYIDGAARKKKSEGGVHPVGPDPEVPTELEKKCEEAPEVSGLSSHKVAEMLGVSIGTVSKYAMLLNVAKAGKSCVWTDPQIQRLREVLARSPRTGTHTRKGSKEGMAGAEEIEAGKGSGMGIDAERGVRGEDSDSGVAGVEGGGACGQTDCPASPELYIASRAGLKHDCWSIGELCSVVGADEETVLDAIGKGTSVNGYRITTF